MMKPTLVWSRLQCPELSPDEAATVLAEIAGHPERFTDHTPKRGRGRPRKPADKTPVSLAEFDATVAVVKSIPPDKAKTEDSPAIPGRNAAKDRARAHVANDARLSRAAVVVFNYLLDRTFWDDGTCCDSIGFIAGKCGMERRTAMRASKALRDAGHALRRERARRRPSETTLPALARAWEAVKEVGTKKSKVGTENSEVGTENSDEVVVFSSLNRDKKDTQSFDKPSQERKELCEGSRQSGSSLASRANDDFQFKIEPKAEAKIEVLHHWRACQYFQEHGVRFNGEPPEAMSLDRWRGWLKSYGGAPELLTTPAAHRQALELAAELRAHTSVTGWLLMAVLAYRVCKAHRDGKRISSYGFIATSIMRDVAKGDYAWLTGLPTRIDQKVFDDAMDLASKSVTALQSWKIPLDAREMTATIKVELLSDLIKEHTRAGMVAAMNRAIEQFKSDGNLEPHLEPGYSISGWGWFKPYIEKPTPTPPPKPETDRQHLARMKEHWARQKAADDARLAEIHKIAEAAVAQLEAAGITVDRYETKKSGLRCRLLAESALNALRLRFPRDLPLAEMADALRAAVARFIADPMRERQKVTAWSNLGDAIRQELALPKE